MRTIYRCTRRETSGLARGTCEYLAKYEQCAKQAEECCMTSYMVGFDTLNIYEQGGQVSRKMKKKLNTGSPCNSR